ncbi:lytic transglycosylase domain-containing protein [Thermodesulfobacteriota bacterium]
MLKGPRPYNSEFSVKSLQPKAYHLKTMSKSRTYYPIIRAAADRYQVDIALIKAVIMAESSYDPVVVSRKGAVGLMQLMPNTAEALGVPDSYDPAHNIDGGVRYLKALLNQFSGDMTLALAAYNAGSRKVREYHGIPPFKATRYYVRKVLDYYFYYKQEMGRDRSKI